MAFEPNVTLGSVTPEGSNLYTTSKSVVVMNEEERLTMESHSLDVTVWLLILCIFTFFFIIIVAVICMQWMERRRSEVRGECLVLPAGPVPGCMTVLSTTQPLLTHYHLLPCYYSAHWSRPSAATRSLSSPQLTNVYKDVINDVISRKQ